VVAPHSSTVTRAAELVQALVDYEGELGMHAMSMRASMGPGQGSSQAPCTGSSSGLGIAEASCEPWLVRPSVAMLLTVERRGVKEMELTGDVAGRDVVIVDDIVDSGNTISRASRELMERGASRVFAVATHGLLSQDAADKLAKAPLDLLLLTNTVPSIIAKLPPEHRLRRKLTVLSVAPMLAHYICEHADLPPPDLDPAVPMYAMHSGVNAPRTAYEEYVRSSLERVAVEEDSQLSDSASMVESQSTASEFSSAAVITN